MRRLLPSLLLVSACSLGPRVKSFPPARYPQGALAEVRRGRDGFRGELLAVTDTALLMVNTLSAHVILVPYGATTMVRFFNLEAFSVSGGRTPEPTVRERLRLWSRYPTGVSADLLSHLLAAYGQSSLDVLSPLPCARRRC
jgi:hypothetical protein